MIIFGQESNLAQPQLLPLTVWTYHRSFFHIDEFSNEVQLLAELER